MTDRNCPSGQMSLFAEPHDDGEEMMRGFIRRRLAIYQRWKKEEPDLKEKIKDWEFDSCYGGNGDIWYDFRPSGVTFRRDARDPGHKFTVNRYINAVEEMLAVNQQEVR